MGERTYDFSGWATKNNLRCSDGRTIRQDAFKENDGQVVPLVWQHQHNDPENVLGHALLENRKEGVYAYGTFNDTEMGRQAKELVEHGDITHLSIFANKLKQIGGDVIHGAIREVSLVLAGANPGALIDSDSIAHSYDEEDDEAIIYTGELIHMESNEKNTQLQHEDSSADSGKTVKEVFDSMTEEQKNVVYFMIGQALEDAGVEDEDVEHSDDEGDDFMKHNVFENEPENNEEVLSHAEMMEILEDAKKCGSLKDACLAHSITDISVLFPDAKAESSTPEFYNQPDEWVSKILTACHHSPFSRIKNMYADITMEQARALGYIKGHEKKEEVYKVLKRVTTPQTIYKKQKLDRDDIIDITDFDVVSWMKGEMNLKLKEELARAIITGDGRDPVTQADDKIDEEHIRPIAFENDMYAEKVQIEIHVGANDSERTKKDKVVTQIMDAMIESRSKYRGSGNPTLYAPVDFLPMALLLKDNFGQRMFKTKKEVEDYLNVKEIVELPFLSISTNYVTDPDDWDSNVNFFFFLVNLNDYTIGTDKGGELNFFDDFDIDFNQYKYLLETRCSGSLRKLKSALRYQIKSVVDQNEGQG